MNTVEDWSKASPMIPKMPLLKIAPKLSAIWVLRRAVKSDKFRNGREQIHAVVRTLVLNLVGAKGNICKSYISRGLTDTKGKVGLDVGLVGEGDVEWRLDPQVR